MPALPAGVSDGDEARMTASDVATFPGMDIAADAREDARDRKNRLDDLANYDALTGHFNRTRLREAVDRVIAADRRQPVAAAFLAVGVDNMSAINDRLGRAAADTVLVEIGSRLDDCLRVSDMIGRLGGDRYGIVLAHCPEPDLPVAAQKILHAVRSVPIATERGTVDARVSIGVASFRNRGATSYEIMTRAEAALADAKAAGRDCHVHFHVGAEQEEASRRGAAVGETVHAALRQSRVVLAFQPVVSAATGEVEYHECLLRLRDAGGEVMPAGDFIQEVERFGHIRLLDRHVLGLVLAVAAANPEVRLGFNISALTTADRPWLRSLTARLRARPDLARRLVIEVTETAALYDIEESARFVSALRRAGCRVALDDFGAGHSSLQYLQSLPVDLVKIDRSFVRGIVGDADSRLFLRHLLGLATGFGLDTVAEGVECEEEAAILRHEGVTYFQGHHFGRAALAPSWLEPPA
jgi:diguanylate cyclase (GGDEF)-like protein